MLQHSILSASPAAGVKPERIFIGGFSQGGALGMQAAFRYIFSHFRMMTTKDRKNHSSHPVPAPLSVLIARLNKNYTTRPSYPHKLGGIINFSGWLTPSTIVGGVQNKPPLLWWHGSADMVVSFPLQRAGVEKLKAMGITDITVKEQPRMGHSSHPDQMEYVPDWINKLLGGKGGQKEEL